MKGALGSQLGSLGKIAQEGPGTGDTFSTVLKDSIEKVNKLQTEADQAIQGLAKGDVNNIHETMIAIEKANLSFNMMVQVRNKLVAAYEEIMRTQV
ncbi:MAG: flagellar hook-basal body complex protein FliE [Deltaproteobacteria bacterium]|nr:flagellar hook-basal body complex protein FliE [Deltaproteobacteria bacterium]